MHHLCILCRYTEPLKGEISRMKPKLGLRTKQKKLAVTFSEETSCHGILQIKNNAKIWLKVFWALLVLAAFSVLIWQIIDRINAYNKHETNTQISEEYVQSVHFPAVTICNSNRYFYFSSDEERLAMLTLSKAFDTGVPQNVSVVQNLGLTSNFSLREFMMAKGWRLDVGGALAFCGVSKTEVCSHVNLTMSLSNSLGLCWTLNAQRRQSIPGYPHGIHLIFITYQSDSTEDPISGNSETGIKFQVHSQDEPPQVESLGHSVGVGLWASVQMHKQEKSNMYSPWGACRPSNENLRFYSKYTLNACLKQCYDTLIQQTCNCRGPLMEYNYEDVVECTPIQVLNCTAPVRYAIESSYTPQKCGCYQPCNEVKYQTTLSYSSFNPKHSEFFEKGMNLSSGYLSENSVGISVYFDALSVTKHVESKAITESALLSDIGGQLGLWVGVSVVTLFELLQFLTRLLYSETRHHTRKAHKGKREKTNDIPIE
uniref:acid-sensing ion channel 5 n=1 Tax=Ciona intestinalis TaxID=7719 RepID=UPI000EF4A770|nr:acid-sensing ion channel 5 [Ciona intestinalis]|eukprot:XP_018667320.2 acid-sensing ion channel 5 [Ciona intestinalis]